MRLATYGTMEGMQRSARSSCRDGQTDVRKVTACASVRGRGDQRDRPARRAAVADRVVAGGGGAAGGAPTVVGELMAQPPELGGSRSRSSSSTAAASWPRRYGPDTDGRHHAHLVVDGQERHPRRSSVCWWATAASTLTPGAGRGVAGRRRARAHHRCSTCSRCGPGCGSPRTTSTPALGRDRDALRRRPATTSPRSPPAFPLDAPRRARCGTTRRGTTNIVAPHRRRRGRRRGERHARLPPATGCSVRSG